MDNKISEIYFRIKKMVAVKEFNCCRLASIFYELKEYNCNNAITNSEAFYEEFFTEICRIIFDAPDLKLNHEQYDIWFRKEGNGIRDFLEQKNVGCSNIYSKVENLFRKCKSD